ncbi:hypothetical protein EA658_14360 [Pseudoxanthomonas winnipegensis]|uniref:Beta protein n=2 Tax=Pseudoxanthomonas winnipegensis TaxID=2480810 RepID=A0ABY1WBF4_9GAMM|nr:beta family protein [Pseudoxanthomonas winnipegensis]TAA10879.1 hypothetical protein EA659_05770 [Pseudoxanthomonas winnipegensis]TAA18305.1 hypothetical protein EA658_14360 [Pseudoxanthomonas winnipegensis]TAH74320.1 hypothetical protein EA657_02390 [Pseudoxanthomonas winnipegensis]
MMNYSPVIRTRAAELRGLKELTDTARRKLFPIVELTRSRRTSKNPAGSISKSVEAICEILGGQPFVADLTSLPSLQNSEFDRLLDDDSGFQAWTRLATSSLPEQCIPVAHLLEPFDLIEFKAQVSQLRSKFSRIAIRVPTNYGDFSGLISGIQEVFSDYNKIFLILDAGYVNERSRFGAAARLNEMLSEVSGWNFFRKSIASSSFPNSVVSAGGEDDQGAFNLSEVYLWKELVLKFPDLTYGDYAGIHPIDFTGTVTNWVPRVDVMLDESFYYHRYRRSEGGYEKAAYEALNDPRYVPLDCWAQENIRLAAGGSPNGRSPSFWIANRVNFHLSRQSFKIGR